MRALWKLNMVDAKVTQEFSEIAYVFSNKGGCVCCGGLCVWTNSLIIRQTHVTTRFQGRQRREPDVCACPKDIENKKHTEAHASNQSMRRNPHVWA